MTDIESTDNREEVIKTRLSWADKIRARKQGLKKLKDLANGKIDEWTDKMTVQVRADFLDRWMEITDNEYEEPCRDYGDIDYSIPQISLEWQLCDPSVLFGLRDPTKRAKFLSLLTDEERDVYLNACDKDGNRYTDLERPLKNQIKMKQVYKRLKR